MKRAKIGISSKLLIKMFKIPKKADVAGCEFDVKHDCIYIYLRNVGKELPECALAELTAIGDLK